MKYRRRSQRLKSTAMPIDLYECSNATSERSRMPGTATRGFRARGEGRRARKWEFPKRGRIQSTRSGLTGGGGKPARLEPLAGGYIWSRAVQAAGTYVEHRAIQTRGSKTTIAEDPSQEVRMFAGIIKPPTGQIYRIPGTQGAD